MDTGLKNTEKKHMRLSGIVSLKSKNKSMKQKVNTQNGMMVLGLKTFHIGIGILMISSLMKQVLLQLRMMKHKN